jgi:hypothetical protein
MMFEKEELVIIDKRNNLVLDHNGHSINPLTSDGMHMRFENLEDAIDALEYDCDVEELNIENYKIGKIKIGYSVLETYDYERDSKRVNKLYEYIKNNV